MTLLPFLLIAPYVVTVGTGSLSGLYEIRRGSATITLGHKEMAEDLAEALNNASERRRKTKH